MRISTVAICFGLMTSACAEAEPQAWDGPSLTDPRSDLTIADLSQPDVLPLLDMSFFARPHWAVSADEPFSGTLTISQSPLDFPKERESYPGEDLFPPFSADFVTQNGALIPAQEGIIDTRRIGESLWDVIIGPGKVWREKSDGGWTRASFPLNLTDRYMGQVRNCVATFAYKADAVSNIYTQCSQETADINAGQIGNIRAMAPATYEPKALPLSILDQYSQREANRLPTRPLSEIDEKGEIARYFDKSLWTNASTTQGAVLLDGTLYVNPPKTRHGLYPYPEAMRFGVYSVSKSLAGALSLFYFAQRYGDEVFDEPVTDYVPALADRPEWQGVTFFHLINMATGTRGGEAGDLLYEPLIIAPTKEDAIRNIAALSDAPPAPGEAFTYATTNTFVLSYALDKLVRAREGADVRYWDLVHKNVLMPIGAGGYRVLHTREEDEANRIPYLGYGALPTLDDAAKIALLLHNEGAHEGRQLLSKQKIREALGRTDWRGYQAGRSRYRHSFWAESVRAGGCKVEVAFMEGHGANHILFLPSGATIFRLMDEFDKNFTPLVRGVEKIRPSCG